MREFRFVYGKNSAGEWYLEILSGNNETIVWSEGYKTEAGVKNAIDLIKKNAASAKIYVRN